jgi:hypothetical protein
VITPYGTSGKVQASVMDVYNINRYRAPSKENEVIEWELADNEIITQLKEQQVQEDLFCC